ncbi:MAG TPA: flagellar hook-associated protein FlgL [Candidatus Hydrogenedentes bacterium]|nr:flagellar hook-associated protein FlgL [Candidatus Hydrogenedentota bacterium]HRK34225.1 flagellar hook-associated protein FlgL [Candidatus Hydrogenedentota bacterium]
MGTGRVTSQILVQRALTNLRNQSNRIIDLQTQLASGLRVNQPSDDPIDARRAINARAAIAKNEQYVQNIASAGPRLEETVTSLQTLTENLLRARELTLRGANGTNDQSSLDILAEEINQILEGVVNTSNHLTGNAYIFGGTRTTQAPFEVTRDVNGDITAVTYVGNTDDISASIGDGVQVVINEPGSAVFQGAEDIFQTLINIRDNMLAGDQASLQNARIAELETIRNQIGQGIARIGAVQNRFSAAEAELEDFQLQLQQLLSDSIDADFADVVLNLNSQSNAYQAALNAASRVIQPSLLDFIQ